MIVIYVHVLLPEISCCARLHSELILHFIYTYNSLLLILLPPLCLLCVRILVMLLMQRVSNVQHQTNIVSGAPRNRTNTLTPTSIYLLLLTLIVCNKYLLNSKC